MQFGLCILQDCSYVLCPVWKNIAQTAKNTIDDVTQKVNGRGHVTNLQWPYDGPTSQAAQALFMNHTRIQHNMASNYKGLYGVFYKITTKVVKSVNIQ